MDTLLLTVTLYLKQRVIISYLIQRKGIEMSPMYLNWKILNYIMVLILMICCMYPQFINIPICNAIMNHFPTPLMVKCHCQKIHQFHHCIDPMLLQEIIKYVIYKIQYTRISSIQICLKLNQDLFVVQVI